MNVSGAKSREPLGVKFNTLAKYVGRFVENLCSWRASLHPNPEGKRERTFQDTLIPSRLKRSASLALFEVAQFGLRRLVAALFSRRSRFFSNIDTVAKKSLRDNQKR